MGRELLLFKALADQTRYNIIQFLMQGEKCVCEIFPRVNRTQSTVSIQLGKLESWGILKSRRQGKKIFFKINDDSVKRIILAAGIIAAEKKTRGVKHEN